MAASLSRKSQRILEKFNQFANTFEGEFFSLKCLRCVSGSVRHHATNVKTVSSSDGEIPSKEQRVSCAEVCFDDYRSAFREKSCAEMARALFVLRVCSFNSIVNNSLQLMTTSEKLLGEKMFSSLMKRTMYGQFVAGDDPISIQETTNKLRMSGIAPMLAIPMEEDVDEGCRELRYTANLRSILDCIELSAQLEQAHPMMQIKVTALLSGDLCAKLSRLYPSPSSEPALVDHVTAAMSGQTKCDIKGLDAEENLSFQRSLDRFRDIGELASQRNVTVWVDAEYTYLNPALNLVSLAMMLNYNKHKPLIGYTYQNYLKGTCNRLKDDVEFIEKKGVCFAAKLVRGAYMDKERRLASELGYEDPVHTTLADTSAMYHRSMDLLLREISKNPSRTAVIIATHNENTIHLAIERMNELQIDPQGGQVFFGQLLGMCDQVSYSLGMGNYLVYKSLPYGSIRDTLPYLCRRAQENRSVLKGVRRERTLLRKALTERFVGLS